MKESSTVRRIAGFSVSGPFPALVSGPGPVFVTEVDPWRAVVEVREAGERRRPAPTEWYYRAIDCGEWDLVLTVEGDGSPSATRTN